MDRLFRIRTIGIVGVVIASLAAQERRHFSPREKAFYIDARPCNSSIRAWSLQ